MRTLLAVTLLPMLACGGAAPAPAPVTAATVAPDTASYRLAAWRHVEQSYQGQPIVNEAGTRIWLTLRRTPTNTGFAVQAVVDSAAVQGATDLPPADVRTARGSMFTGRTDRSGHVTDWPLPGQAGPLLQQLHGSLIDLLPVLPEQGVTPGTTWSDTTTVSTRAAGIPVEVRTIAHHRAAETWQGDGVERALPITTLRSYTLSGEGERDGQWLILQGEGRSHLARTVSVRGVVVRGTRADTLDLAVEVSSAGLIIPVRQFRTDTVERVLP